MSSSRFIAESNQVKMKAGHAFIRPLRDDEGTTLVELALILPTFFLTIFGLINFMLVLFGICNLSYASRSATRYACLHSSTSLAPATTASITAVLTPFIYQYPSNTVTPTISYSNGNIVGSTATISVTVSYKIILPLFAYKGLKLKTAASGLITQ